MSDVTSVVPACTRPDVVQDPDVVLKGLGSGLWDMREGEGGLPRRRFLLYLALGPERSLPKLELLLRELNPRGGTPCRLSMLQKHSTTWEWVSRASAWDAEVERLALPHVQRAHVQAMTALASADAEEIERVRLRHADAARQLQDIVMRDLEVASEYQDRRAEWLDDVKAGVASIDTPPARPHLVLPAKSLVFALSAGQQLERKSLSMDVREQALLDKLVPAEERNVLADALEGAIAALPPEEAEAHRADIEARLRELEGRRARV